MLSKDGSSPGRLGAHFSAEGAEERECILKAEAAWSQWSRCPKRRFSPNLANFARNPRAPPRPPARFSAFWFIEDVTLEVSRGRSERERAKRARGRGMGSPFGDGRRRLSTLFPFGFQEQPKEVVAKSRRRRARTRVLRNTPFRVRY
eukprot:1125660-Amorphochlora_amoeboformis.AAC.2